MKTIIVSLFGLAALALPSCTTVEQRDPSSHTSTTTTGVTPAVYGTTETRTTRTY
jgi:hypothetical protein